MWSNPHDFIEFTFHVKANIFAKTAPLYEQGLSLREIELRTGIPKATIRTQLIRGGISLRPSRRERISCSWRSAGKRNVKPPYGFCYLEGQIVKHLKEYPVLLMIHSRWKSGATMNSIAMWLNGEKIPSPMNRKWSWHSINLIVERFKNKVLIVDGGKCEFR